MNLIFRYVSLPPSFSLLTEQFLKMKLQTSETTNLPNPGGPDLQPPSPTLLRNLKLTSPRETRILSLKALKVQSKE
ncbi:hypothetical protein COLO4_03913 [Corchorus olitorius]|uniref:Uncharacterized protein n=1 Tax=Corchorus olitorius TaxID=93759 RepID=A0A1R3KW08_9ROSI|nr:hypothetical protein COLO4_03913 [Corchorus olitorius]